MRNLLLPGAWAHDPVATVDLDAATQHRLRRVLRLADGAALTVSDGAGARATARLAGDALVLTGAIDRQPPSPQPLWLALPPLKGDRADWAVEKAAELGVDCIVPLHSHHGVVRLRGERAAALQQRWQALCDAALEQCGRRHRVVVHTFLDIAELATLIATGADRWLVADERPAVAMTLDAAVDRCPATGGLGVVIGPEGALDGGEREALAAAGAMAVTLGPEVLRAETAAVAAAVRLAALRAARCAVPPVG